MTVLDQAMLIVRSVARSAECEEIPGVRIVFANPSDQARFKLELIKSLPDDHVVRAPIGGTDHLEISGLEVELVNKDRGSRATLANIIKVAEKALADGFNQRIRAADILAMRQSLSDLLKIVKG